MPLTDADIARAERWCRTRTPEHLRDQLRVELDRGSNHLDVLECRPVDPAVPDGSWLRAPITRLRYSASSRSWRLFWADRNDRFRAYEDLPQAARVDDLLDEIDRDPYCLFWG